MSSQIEELACLGDNFVQYVSCRADHFIKAQSYLGEIRNKALFQGGDREEGRKANEAMTKIAQKYGEFSQLSAKAYLMSSDEKQKKLQELLNQERQQATQGP